jgi:hypothetical protein
MSKLNWISALGLVAMAMSTPASAQLGPFVPGTYTTVRETRLTTTLFEYEMRLTVANQGTANAINVSAVASSNHPNVTIVASANSLTFGSIGANSTATSSNTFRFRFNRTVAFQPSMINWTFNATVAAPTANAGGNQSVNLGDLVTLNGSTSSDPNGLPLTREWTLTPPNGCAGVTLSSTTAVMPTFPANCVGTFTASLIVRNSLNVASAPSVVTISTAAVPPTANAGPNQTLSLTQVNQLVSLNGSGSTSPGNLPLTYSWSFQSLPQGSNATLSNPTAIQPTFIADRIGIYLVNLTVNNGFFTSPVATVQISASNQKPTANAGANQSATINSLVQLNGSASTDPNSLPLTYTWSITTAPGNNFPPLSNPNAVNPTFTLATTGTYIAQLIVCNAYQCSDPATVTISTQLLPPTANAGSGQTVNVGTPVNLSGLASSDPQNLPLTYSWSITSRPATSTAQLNSLTSPTPSFTPDRHGDYQVQLTVSNGTLTSNPVTVLISTNYVPPTANAGSAQNVIVNATVNLSGLASQSFSGYPLTYAWSFNTRPNGSNASFSNATAAQPTFVPDLPGTYIVQLIVNDTIQNSPGATVQINASFGNSVTITAPTTLLTFGAALGTATLSSPAGTGGVTVNLASSGTAAVTIPSSVVVPAGNSGANFNITAGGNAGSFTITGSVNGYAPGQATTTVSNRTLTVAVTQPLLTTAQTFNGTVTLNDPAPSGGLSVNLASLNPAFVTVSPNVLSIPAGQTVGNFTYTGVSVGNTSIEASGSGITTASTAVTVTGNRIQLPASFTANLGQATSYPVSLTTAAPSGGLTVTLTPSNAAVTISPSVVVIPAGQTTPVATPTITGAALGQFTVTATGNGYAPDTQNVAFNITISANPASTTINAGQTADVNVTLSANAPTGGITLNLSGNNTAVATVPAQLTIPAGQSSTTLTVTAVAAGSTSLSITGPANTVGGSLNITVQAVSPVSFQGGTDLARNAQEVMNVQFGQNVGPNGVAVTVRSLSSSLRISSSPTAVGGTTLTLSATPNSSVLCCFYVQNIDTSAGAGDVEFSAPGFATTTRTYTFSPGGFTLVPDTINTSTSAPASSLSIRYQRLTAGNVVASTATLRGGYSESIAIANPTPAVATVTSPLTFSGNSELQTYAAAVTPQPAGGTTTLTITQPSGYAVPTTGQSTVVNVANRTVSLGGNLTIGRNQQSAVSLQVSSVLPTATTFTISTVSTGTQLSTSPTTVGTGTINVVLPANTSSTTFYVQNVNQDSGTPTLSISSSSPLVQNADRNVTFTRSGFYLWSGSGASVTLNLSSSPANAIVYFAAVTETGARITELPMRPGLSETFTFSTSPTGIVTLPANGTFNSSTSDQITLSNAITPTTVGTTAVSIVQPANYVAVTTYPSLSVTVNNNRAIVTNIPAVGYDQVRCSSVTFSPAIPAGGATLTISSPGAVTFSGASSVAGTNPYVVTVNAGASSAAYCVHNMGASTGSAVVTAALSNSSATYASGTSTTALWPSGFYPWTPTITLETVNTTGAALQIWFAMINPSNNTYAGDFPLRPNATSRTLALNSSDTSRVVVPASVVFPADGSTNNLNYPGVLDNAPTPLAGSSVITLTQPANHSANINYFQSTVNVVAPQIIVNCSNVIGFNLQTTCSASFTTLVSASTISLSSNNANLLLSNVRTASGSVSLNIPVNAGTSSVTFYAQSLASAGAVQVTASIPSYNSGTSNITLSPSGFYTYPTGTTTVGGNASIQVWLAALNPDAGNTYNRDQELRGGLTYTINLQSSNPGIAGPLPSVTFATTPGSQTGVTQFANVTGAAVGQTTINPIQPVGFVQTTSYQYVLRVN